MRYGRALLMLFTALVLSGIVWIAARQGAQTPQEPRLWLRVSGEEGSQRIACWADPAGGYYGFLPSYADLEQVTLEPERGTALTLNGQAVENGMSCRGLSLDTAYPAAFTTEAGRLDTTLTLLRSANVPAMYIDTQSGSMDRVHALKENKESGQMALYSAGGQLEYSGDLAAISGRGNSTWTLDKKPYNLNLSQEADLLGMGAAQKWILLANANDITNLRNKIAYDFAAQIGMDYSPRSWWVDLYLNGEYAGLYLLCTRNEVHAQRVDLSPKGSFLVSMDLKYRMQSQNNPYVEAVNSQWMAFRVHYAGMNTDTMAEILRAVENAIIADDGLDPETGTRYTDLIDLDSWAMRYLLDEVFGNYDGGSLSQFFYYDAASADGKVYAGPIWDMDNCMGWGGYAPTMIWAGRSILWTPEDTPLFHALMEKEAFRQRVLELYEQVFVPAQEELLGEKMGEYAQFVQQATRVNAIRWGEDGEGSDAIGSYLRERMVFLEEYFFGDAGWHLVEVEISENVWRCYAVPNGQSLSQYYESYVIDEKLGPRYWSEEDQCYVDIDAPVLEDKTLRLEQTAVSDEEEASESFPLKQAAPAAFAGGIFICLTILDRSRRKGSGRKRKEGSTTP